jgi:hypothetical protein
MRWTGSLLGDHLAHFSRITSLLLLTQVAHFFEIKWLTFWLSKPHDSVIRASTSSDRGNRLFAIQVGPQAADIIRVTAARSSCPRSGSAAGPGKRR